MGTDALILLVLVLGICLGAGIGIACYATDLTRIVRFLRTREPESCARATIGGREPGIVALVEAINDELDRSERMHVEALRHQQEFQRDLSALSHDIRTPLAGAKGYLQLASNEADADALRHQLDAATARIDATTELLDQLFAYTKSTDPDLKLTFEEIALRPLVEEILLGQYPAFEERGWEPAVSFDDPAATVEADRAALGRILQNLVVNALRHGSGAPTITQTSAVDSAGARRIVLVVSNPVLDPAAIDPARLFDRFYQADSARGAGGSGLGLSVAANLARVQGIALAAELVEETLSIRITL